jgi:hypothetical protein
MKKINQNHENDLPLLHISAFLGESKLVNCAGHKKACHFLLFKDYFWGVPAKTRCFP